MKPNSILSGPVAAPAPACRPFHDPVAMPLDDYSGRSSGRRPTAFFDRERVADPGKYAPATKAAKDMTAEESQAELHRGMGHMIRSAEFESQELGEYKEKTTKALQECKEAAADKATLKDVEDLNNRLVAIQRSGLIGEPAPKSLEEQNQDLAACIARRAPKACEAVAKAFVAINGRGLGAVNLCPEGGVIVSAGAGEIVQKAESNTSASAAAILTPELTLDIYDLLLTYGAFRTLDVRRMSTKQQKLTVKNSRPTAFWVKDNQEIPESGINLGTLSLTAALIGVIDGFSRAFLADSPIDLGAMILADFLEAVAYRMDYSCFLGDGTDDVGGINGAILGIVNAGTVVTAGAGGTTVGAMKYADVLAVQTGAPQAIYGRMPAWWMNPLILGAFLGILDGNGRPIFQQALDVPRYGSLGNLNGFPVNLANVLPGNNSAGNPVAIFGDGKAFAVGVRQDFEFTFSDEVRFTSNQRVFRGLMRGTGGMKNPLALRVLKTAAA